MIKINNLCKTYNPMNEPVVKALDNVSLTLGDMGIVFVLGKSGSGKSTLLNALGCLDNFDSGDIILNNKSLKSLSQREFDNYRNTHIGFIFQENNLLEKISIKNNIGLALDLQGIKDKDALINSALEKVDLKGYSSRYPNQLSGGQKQRVAIARSIVKNPAIVLADEPTGNLDSATSKQIFELLKELSRDRLVIVVSHDREAAELYGDRVIELVDGRIHKDSSPLEEQERAIIKIKEDTNKVRYPFKKMLAMSLNNMKAKWIRMLVTIILFVFALTLFGLGISASTIDINIQTLNALNEIEEEIIHIAPDLLPDTRTYLNSYNLSFSNIKLIEDNLTEFEFDYIYDGSHLSELDYSNSIINYYYNTTEMAGCMVMNQSDLDKYNMTILTGRLPVNQFEVAIPYYIYEAFQKKGYNYYGDYSMINNYQDIIGLELKMSRNNDNSHTIVGIIDTNFDHKRFESLKTFNEDEATAVEYNRANFLKNALNIYTVFSVHASLFVTQDYIDREFLNNMTFVTPGRFMTQTIFGYEETNYITKTGSYSNLVDNQIQVKGLREDFDGLSDNEIIVSRSFIDMYLKRKDSPYNYSYTEASLNSLIANGLTIELMIGHNTTNYHSEKLLVEYNVKGYYDNYIKKDDEGYYQSEIFFNDSHIENIIYNDRIYKSIFTKLSNNRDSNLKLIGLTYNEDLDDKFYFPIKTIIRHDLDLFKSETSVYRKVGLFASIAFGLFTALMMLNFIVSNIIAKIKETGLLRALGLSSRDVFIIFFMECIIISIISFALCIYPLFVVSNFLSVMSHYYVLMMPYFTINALSLMATLIISILIAFMGSFMPIYKIAKKKPVEIIRS